MTPLGPFVKLTLSWLHIHSGLLSILRAMMQEHTMVSRKAVVSGVSEKAQKTAQSLSEVAHKSGQFQDHRRRYRAIERYRRRKL